MANKQRKVIEADLLAQLQCNGTATPTNIDLVKDYMEMWDCKNLFIADVQERGAVVEHFSNTGKINTKKNESIDGLLRVNKQMLLLLESLGLEPATGAGEPDEEL